MMLIAYSPIAARKLSEIRHDVHKSATTVPSSRATRFTPRSTLHRVHRSECTFVKLAPFFGFSVGIMVTSRSHNRRPSRGALNDSHGAAPLPQMLSPSTSLVDDTDDIDLARGSGAASGSGSEVVRRRGAERAVVGTRGSSTGAL